MEEHLPITAITPAIADWTCKVRLVDIGKPGEGREHKIKYMNMIFQDQEKSEVKAIIYGDDISLYRGRFILFHTYLITSARVQQPTLRYEKPLHTYEWIIDKKTIVDAINEGSSTEDTDHPSTPNNMPQIILPPPTIITMASFQEISNEACRCTKEQLRNAEFNVLAVVVNCYPPRYVTSMQKRLQELIIIDSSKQAFTFTLWEEAIIEDEGARLLSEFPSHPIIFARRVGVSKYNGTSLTTKFNTTIQITPPYAECTALQSWVTANTAMLNSFAVRSTSQSGSLLSAPVEEHIVPIADIHSHQDGQTFTIEARIKPPQTFSCCYVLACPSCKQEVRNLRKRTFQCTSCNEENVLIARCRFEATLADASGTIKGTIMDEQAEELLSLNAEQIYDKVHSDFPGHEHPKIPDTHFRIQVKKTFPRGGRPSSQRVFIVAINNMNKTASPSTASTTANIQVQHKRPKQDIILREGKMADPTKMANIPRIKEEMEPPTPSKQQ